MNSILDLYRSVYKPTLACFVYIPNASWSATSSLGTLNSWSFYSWYQVLPAAPIQFNIAVLTGSFVRFIIYTIDLYDSITSETVSSRFWKSYKIYIFLYYWKNYCRRRRFKIFASRNRPHHRLPSSDSPPHRFLLKAPSSRATSKCSCTLTAKWRCSYTLTTESKPQHFVCK